MNMSKLYEKKEPAKLLTINSYLKQNLINVNEETRSVEPNLK